jgi:hypothetical protein
MRDNRPCGGVQSCHWSNRGKCSPQRASQELSCETGFPGLPDDLAARNATSTVRPPAVPPHKPVSVTCLHCPPYLQVREDVMKVERQIKREEPQRQALVHASSKRDLKQRLSRVLHELQLFDLSTDESTRISPPLPESASCWYNCSPRGRLCFWDASAQQEMMLPVHHHCPPHHFCLPTALMLCVRQRNQRPSYQ